LIFAPRIKEITSLALACGTSTNENLSKTSIFPMELLESPVLSAIAFIISLAFALSFLPILIKNRTCPGPAPVSPNSSAYAC